MTETNPREEKGKEIASRHDLVRIRNDYYIVREKADVPISQEADLASEIGKLFKRNAQHFKPKGGEVKEMRLSGGSIQSVSSGLFTVTASGLTIEVDSPVKLELVKKLVEDADKQFKQSSKDKERQESEKESK